MPRKQKRQSPAPPTVKRGGTLYRPEYCERVIEHMALGHSFASFGGVVRVTRRCLYKWVDAHEEFKEAHEVGVSTCLNKLESILLLGATGRIKNFQAVPVIFMMKNICPEDYRDVQRHEHAGDAERPILISNLTDAELEKIATRGAK